MPTVFSSREWIARQNQRWRVQQLEQLPPSVQGFVRNKTQEVEWESGYKEANSYIGHAAGTFKQKRKNRRNNAHINHAFEEQAIRDHAENYARIASRISTLDGREEFAAYQGVVIDPVTFGKYAAECRMARLECPRWWRHQLRKYWTRDAENTMRDLGMIQRRHEPYASEEAVRHHKAMRRCGRDYLKSHALQNEEGEQLEMWEVADKNVSNPALRRKELMVRIKGFEEIAMELGHVGDFVTLTAPSAFHAQKSEGGRNPRWAPERVVREAQAWLCRMWARVRAKLKRLSIYVYGFRVAEPHHDGTPHWHLLFFTTRHHQATVRRVLREIWLSEFSDEPGAHHVRCDFTDIDARKGSASGYLAKYVAKNIDGAGAIATAQDHETGKDIAGGLIRVRTWASIHGIRQFQQIGGPPVGLWRELRRIRVVQPHPVIERARYAASEQKSWAAMVRAVGGISVGRCTTVRVWKEELGTLSRYGDLQGSVPAGVMYGSVRVRSRHHVWRVVRSKACQAGNGRPRGTVDREEENSKNQNLNQVFSPPWTCGNNCTVDGEGNSSQQHRESG